MQAIKTVLDTLKLQSNFRELSSYRHEGIYLYKNNFTRLLNLSSNDYLCMSDFFDEFANSELFKKNMYFSSASSRSLSGGFEVFFEFEEYLYDLFFKKAILFNSGYHANLGAISSLAMLGNVLFVIDRNIHASIIDGLKSFKRVNFKRYHHNNMESLNKILENSSSYDAVFVISEGLFSMDGDFANLREIVSLKRKYKNTYIYLDEAHSIGTVGCDGLGLAKSLGLLEEIDFLIIAFGKAIGSFGACVLSSKDFSDYFVNKARSLIYSTAIAPINVAMSYFAFQKLQMLQHRREELTNLSSRFRNMLKSCKYEIIGDYNIIGIVLGSNERAVYFQKYLEERGYYLPAIKEPTVQKNRAMLRISLNSGLSCNMLEDFIENFLEIDNEYLS